MVIPHVFGPTQPSLPVTTALRGRALLVARVAWVALAALMIGVGVIAFQIQFAQMWIICTASDSCIWAQPTPDLLRDLQSLGISLDNYVLAANGLQLLVAATFIGTGIVIFWRRSDDWMALFTGLLLVSIGASLFETPLLFELYPALFVPARLTSAFSEGSMLVFAGLFPNGRWAPRGMRVLAIVWIAWILFAQLADNMLALPVWLGFIIFLCGLATMLGAQAYRYAFAASALERLQIKWLLFGLLSLVLCGISYCVTTVFIPTVGQPGSPAELAFGIAFNLVQLALPISIGVAMLRYRLWEIDPILNRALVYGVLTALVFAIYVLIVGYLGSLFSAEGNLAISIIATGVVAVLFQPLRSRVQRAINRLLYGERDDPYTVLSGLSRQLAGTLAPDSVFPTIVETVAATLRLPYVAIVLQTDAEWESDPSRGDDAHAQVVAAYGEPPAWPLIELPLMLQGEQIGWLRLAPQSPSEPFSAADRRLLSDLARQTGVAVQAVRLTVALQRSRERLVTAREEERRRLRRDLHDGLGPELASHTLTLEATRDLIRTDPATAESLLSGLIDQSQVMLTDIRRLVYALRPPALDELGLVSALREQVVTFERQGMRIEIATPERLPALPAAVEVAAYRIAQEALTNVVKHARAEECRVTLELVGDGRHRTLGLEIQDDGLGLPPARRPGIGLNSMRERAEELGGICVIAPRARGGTRVSAYLPAPEES